VGRVRVGFLAGCLPGVGWTFGSAASPLGGAWRVGSRCSSLAFAASRLDLLGGPPVGRSTVVLAVFPVAVVPSGGTRWVYTLRVSLTSPSKTCPSSCGLACRRLCPSALAVGLCFVVRLHRPPCLPLPEAHRRWSSQAARWQLASPVSRCLRSPAEAGVAEAVPPKRVSGRAPLSWHRAAAVLSCRAEAPQVGFSGSHAVGVGRSRARPPSWLESSPDSSHGVRQRIASPSTSACASTPASHHPRPDEVPTGVRSPSRPWSLLSPPRWGPPGPSPGGVTSRAASARSCHAPCSFRPCRFPRLRRFAPHMLRRHLQPAADHEVHLVSSGSTSHRPVCPDEPPREGLAATTPASIARHRTGRCGSATFPRHAAPSRWRTTVGLRRCTLRRRAPSAAFRRMHCRKDAARHSVRSRTGGCRSWSDRPLAEPVETGAWRGPAFPSGACLALSGTSCPDRASGRPLETRGVMRPCLCCHAFPTGASPFGVFPSDTAGPASPRPLAPSSFPGRRCCWCSARSRCDLGASRADRSPFLRVVSRPRVIRVPCRPPRGRRAGLHRTRPRPCRCVRAGSQERLPGKPGRRSTRWGSMSESVAGRRRRRRWSARYSRGLRRTFRPVIATRFDRPPRGSTARCRGPGRAHTTDAGRACPRTVMMPGRVPGLHDVACLQVPCDRAATLVAPRSRFRFRARW
jgi:hypothetical protein